MTVDEQQAAGIAEIQKLFSGRRRHHRSRCGLALEVRGHRKRFPARMIDVSPRGALIGLAMEDFLPSGGCGSLMEVASLVPKRFPDGMTIRVLSAELRLEATVVRVAAGTSEPHILFGCLFRRLLTRRQCRALGVVEIEPGDEPRFAS